MTQLGYPPCLPDIVEEHFEELDFLWEQREGVVFAPDWTVEDLAELEERAEAHLDGLRVAELHAVDLVRPALAGDETCAATAATFVFMETGEQAFADEVLQSLEAAETPELRDGIRIGLRHSAIETVRERLVDWAERGGAPLAVAAADVLAFHRVPFDDVERLTEAEDPEDRRVAYGAMGRLRRLRQVDRLRGAFDDPDARVQRSALEAAAMSGLPGLEDWCRRAALDPEAPSLEAMRFLGVFGAATDLALLEAAAEDEECAAAALDAIGMLGRVEAIPRLVALIEAGAPSDRPAALAYRRITGMEDLAADKPPAPPIDPTDVDSEFDDDEPPPDVERARAWWGQHADRFDPARRFKDGVDVSAGWAAAASPLISLASTLELQLAACASDPEATAASVELAGRARGRAAG